MSQSDMKYHLVTNRFLTSLFLPGSLLNFPDGSVFGVSLSTLLEKDQQIVSEPHSVPLVFQKVTPFIARFYLSLLHVRLILDFSNVCAALITYSLVILKINNKLN